MLGSITPVTPQRIVTENNQYNQIWGRGVITRNNIRWFVYSQGTDTYLVGLNPDGSNFRSPQRVNQVTNLQQDECELYLDRVTGNMLVMWSDRSSVYTEYMAAVGRGYDEEGNPLTDEFSMFDTDMFSQTVWRPLGYPLKDGGFAVVATTHWGEEVCMNIVHAERPPSTPGTIINSPQWSSQNQEYPCVASNVNNDLMVVWANHNGAINAQTPNNLPDLIGVLVRDFIPLETENRVTEPEASDGRQREPRLASGAGDFYLTWQSRGDIYIRKFDAQMSPLTDTIRVNEDPSGNHRDPQIFVRLGKSVVVVWEHIDTNGDSSIQCRWMKDDLSFISGDTQVNTIPVGRPNIASQLDRATPGLYIRKKRMMVTWGGQGNQRDVFYREFILDR